MKRAENGALDALCDSKATDASIPMSKAGNCGLKNSEDEPQEIKKQRGSSC